MAINRPEVAFLVPHSGIQFLTFELDLERSPRFSRSFIERVRPGELSASGAPMVELLPGWNDDDPDLDPPYVAEGKDNTYDISKQKALEAFVGQWVPLPLLSVLPNRDKYGRNLLKNGPTNWCRVKVTPAPIEGEATGARYIVVIAIDTEIFEERPNRPYVAPTVGDVQNLQEFALASSYVDIGRFISARTPGPAGHDPVDTQVWVAQWIDECFVEFRRAQRGGRVLRPEDRQPLEHASRYISFVQLLANQLKIPNIRFIDSVSADPVIKPVHVDLVLDIGNSRTCGLIIQNFPNKEKVDLGDSFVLQLRDLDEPHLIYSDAFVSDVQLAATNFGRDNLSRASTRSRAFVWPSLVRTGPQAARLRDASEGTEATSGLSSPKRYLCDIEPVNQEWSFQQKDYGANGERPIIDLAARRYLNARGDVLRQVEEERRFYEKLTSTFDRQELSKPAGRDSYSRSSFFTFLVAELIVQTMSLINSPVTRRTLAEENTPRRLHNIIFSLPTAMPVREQRLFRSRAQAAVKLVWDLMGWTAVPPRGVIVPEVRAAWDEGSCAHLVYLYSEIAQKFAGNMNAFVELTGRRRAFADANEAPADKAQPEPSLRIASIDIGGGSTDLLITTYYVQNGRALVPSQTFREGYRIAGEDLIKTVISHIVLPAIGRALASAGLSAWREFLSDRFGSDRANLAQQDRHRRRQFVLRVLRPVALALIYASERSQSDPESVESKLNIGSLFERGSLTGTDNIFAYVDAAAAEWGAANVSIAAVDVPVDLDEIRRAVEGTLGEVIDNIAEAIHHFDCDLVLLSGRPSKLPPFIDLFINKLAVLPDRIVPLANYPTGNWYPIGGKSRFYIDDPKSVTVVGCMLCALAESQITNFALVSKRLAMKSTALQIGVLESNGKMLDANVILSANNSTPRGASQENSVAWHAPMVIGFRQLPHERWIAKPMYRIKPLGGFSTAMIRKPVTIMLEREMPDDFSDYDSRDFSATEALKEELRISEATANDGASVTRSFGLFLDTLGSDDAYWLETGVLGN